MEKMRARDVKHAFFQRSGNEENAEPGVVINGKTDVTHGGQGGRRRSGMGNSTEVKGEVAE